MTGQSGLLVVEPVAMEEYRLAEETNHWKQVTQSVIASANTEKKETAPSNSVVPRIFMVSQLIHTFYCTHSYVVHLRKIAVNVLFHIFFFN